ncbi:MAG: DUF1289 domain-containing protein [Kiloniellales bacterium]
MTDNSPPDAADADDARRQRRERRRARARRFDTSVPSPCIAVCQIDDDSGCCIGCFRDIDEIRDWPIMTAEEKRAVLARVAARKAAAGT